MRLWTAFVAIVALPGCTDDQIVVLWFLVAVASCFASALLVFAAWRTVEMFTEVKGLRQDLAVLGGMLQSVTKNQEQQIALQKVHNEAMAELLPDEEG